MDVRHAGNDRAAGVLGISPRSPSLYRLNVARVVDADMHVPGPAVGQQRLGRVERSHRACSLCIMVPNSKSINRIHR